MKINCPLILASGSPRRRLLLNQLGLKFNIHVSDVEETFNPDDKPEIIVQKLAEKKAGAVAPEYPDSLTLAADTIVVLNGEILGKPIDQKDASRMLALLSGKQHYVYTGISLMHPVSKRSVQAFASTKVTFAQMTPQEIESYVSTGSPLDKAGSYGIQDDQGSLYILGVEGDYYNVVGLPLRTLYEALKSNFDDLLIL